MLMEIPKQVSSTDGGSTLSGFTGSPRSVIRSKKGLKIMLSF